MSVFKMKPKDFKNEVKKGKIKIAVVGLGWMGLPLACLLADAGGKVIGVDINHKKVDAVNKGNCLISEEGLPKLLKKNVSSGKLKATKSIREAITKSRVIFITVPTLVDKHGMSDYSILENLCQNIGRSLQENSLVILESTVAPNITERIVKTTLEKHSGLKAGKDFGLAYSPIRAMGGRVLKDVKRYDKIVGANDRKSLELTSAIHQIIVKGKVRKVNDLKTAEASKIFETIYRDINIALVNELAKFCEKAEIDFIEAKNAANTQPYSHLHIPSIGVGGHCLPLYPHMLFTEAKMLDLQLKFIKEGRKVNQDMPRYILRLIASGLRACGKTLKRSKVTILGIAYRPDIKEVRFSPTLDLIHLLKRRGCRIKVYDPYFSHSELLKMGYKTEPTLRRTIENSDCIVLTVAHEEFRKLRPQRIVVNASNPCAIIDGTHILDPKEVEKVGAIYRGVGRGIWSK